MKHMALYTVVAHGAVHISVRHLHVYGYIHMAIRIAMSTHARKTFCNLRGLVEYPWRCLSSWPPPRAPAGGQPGPQRNTPPAQGPEGVSGGALRAPQRSFTPCHIPCHAVYHAIYHNMPCTMPYTMPYTITCNIPCHTPCHTP